jgi:hypothetical protein
LKTLTETLIALKKIAKATMTFKGTVDSNEK